MENTMQAISSQVAQRITQFTDTCINMNKARINHYILNKLVHIGMCDLDSLEKKIDDLTQKRNSSIVI